MAGRSSLVGARRRRAGRTMSRDRPAERTRRVDPGAMTAALEEPSERRSCCSRCATSTPSTPPATSTSTTTPRCATATRKRAADVLRQIDAGARRACRAGVGRLGPRRLGIGAAVVAVAAVGGCSVAHSSGQRLPGDEITGGVAEPDSVTALLVEARAARADGDAATRDGQLTSEVLDRNPKDAEALTYSGWLLFIGSARRRDDALTPTRSSAARQTARRGPSSPTPATPTRTASSPSSPRGPTTTSPRPATRASAAWPSTRPPTCGPWPSVPRRHLRLQHPATRARPDRPRDRPDSRSRRRDQMRMVRGAWAGAVRRRRGEQLLAAGALEHPDRRLAPVGRGGQLHAPPHERLIRSGMTSPWLHSTVPSGASADDGEGILERRSLGEALVDLDRSARGGRRAARATGRSGAYGDDTSCADAFGRETVGERVGLAPPALRRRSLARRRRPSSCGARPSRAGRRTASPRAWLRP